MSSENCNEYIHRIVSSNEEELVMSGYGHFDLCFYTYCFVWLILVNFPILINNYLAIVDLVS